MKIHLVQKRFDDHDPRPFLEEAVSEAADLVCFGELAGTGCLYETQAVDPLDAWLAKLKSYDIAVMLGLPLQSEDGLTNSYIYHDRGNTLVYNKINLFEPMNETSVYRPGSSPGLFDTKFGRLGVAICYDLRFPDLFVKLKENGAEMIFVPAAWPDVRIDQWRDLLVERARTLAIPVCGINSVGDDGRFKFGGCSMAVDRDGTILAQADELSETVLKIEI